MGPHVVVAEASHVQPIADHARPSDVAEVAAAGGRSIHEALTDGVKLSRRAWTIMVGDTPIAMFGSAPSDVEGLGIAWMLGTPELENHATYFLKRCRRYIRLMHGDDFHTLMNYIDARNEMTIGWLKWCGFETVALVEAGPQALPFYLFTRYQDV